MVLILDLGNTNLYVGIYQNGTLIKDYRTDSDLNRSQDMYATLIKNFVESNHFKTTEFEGAILSSVIPSLTYSIASCVESVIGKRCMVLNKTLKSGLNIRIDNPSELGADMIADSIGAINKYSYPCIICDLGTANKLMVVDKNKSFIGCVITPGIKTAQKALSTNAAQLMDISYIAPEKVIGKNSMDSLNSGAIYGTVSQILGLQKLIEKELGYSAIKILTGGNANLVKNYLPSFTYDKTLILDGLYQIYLKNKESFYEK